MNSNMTAAERKAVPVCTGCLDYFPDALCEVAVLSKPGSADVVEKLPKEIVEAFAATKLPRARARKAENRQNLYIGESSRVLVLTASNTELRSNLYAIGPNVPKTSTIPPEKPYLEQNGLFSWL